MAVNGPLGSRVGPESGLDCVSVTGMAKENRLEGNFFSVLKTVVRSDKNTN